MATQLFVNISANSIASALVRSVIDMTPVSFPQLVVGDGRDYQLYFVDGSGDYATFSGNAAFTPFIAIGECGYPSGGTAVWTFNGDSTSALAWNISPAALQTALQALGSIGSGNATVAGVAGKYYTVTFTGTLGSLPQPEITVNFDGLIPASTVEISTLVEGSASPATNEVQLATLALNPLTFADDWTAITNGWTGQLSTRTLEVIEAFVTAGGELEETFQITVADPVGVRSTYLKVAASIQCTIINPESFAGADKPLLATQAALNAAVLGLNNFTRESLSSSVTGNTNITRATTSRHHTAVIAITGTAGTRTLSVLTANSPNAGDTVLLVIQPDVLAGYVLEVHNATSGGPLIEAITTTDNGRDFFVMLNYTGTAWQLDFSDKPTDSSGVPNAYSAVSNSAGNTTISRLAPNTVKIVNVTGSARTSIMIMDITGAISGDVAKLRLNLPTAASIIIEVRDVISSGTLLFSITTDGSGDDAYLELYFDGSGWKPLLNVMPVV